MMDHTTNRHVVNTVIVDENVPTSFELNSDLTLNICANVDNDSITIQADILTKTSTNELVSISKPTLKTNWNKTATIKIADSNSNALIFMVTPSIVK